MAWLLLILIGVSGLHAGTREEMDRRVTQLRIAGDLPAAIAVLTSWIDEHRNDEEVRLRLGQLYLHSGNSDRALMTWQLLLRELTPDADRWRQIASRLRRAGMTEEAIGLLEEAPSPVALDGTLAWELAELYLEVGRYAAAVTTHFRQVRREPRRRSLLENRIAALAAQDRRFGAQRAGETRCQRYCDEFTAAAESSVDRVNTAHLLATCALETGQPEKGLNYLQSLGGEERASAIYQYASRCEARGFFEAAATAYALFAQLDGDSPYRHRSLLKQAQLREASGDAEGAIALYQAVYAEAEGQPEAFDALLRTARLKLERLHQPGEALAVTEVLLKRFGVGQRRRQVLQLRADCQIQLGELGAAQSTLTELTAVDEEGATMALFRQAELAFYLGRFDSVSTLVDSAVQRSPSLAIANDGLQLMVTVEHHRSDPEGLQIYAETLLRRRQGADTDALSGLWSRLQHRNSALFVQSKIDWATELESVAPEQALAIYAQLAQKTEANDRSGIAIRMGRARTQERLGRLSVALRSYEEILLNAPDDPLAPEVRLEVQRLRALTAKDGT